jgi:hypothetical protein
VTSNKSKYNENALNCRVDPVFLALKKQGESNREFIERALICLRDNDLTPHIDGRTIMNYEILVKLIRAFMQSGINVPDITENEGNEIRSIIQREGLA